MVGNISKKAYKSFNNGEEILLDCLNEDEHLRQPYLEAFKLISKIHKMLFNEFPTKEETENCAKACVCSKIFMPHCDVNTKVKFDNECIAKCHQQNCPESK